jgi:hypothetical protein
VSQKNGNDHHRKKQKMPILGNELATVAEEEFDEFDNILISKKPSA